VRKVLIYYYLSDGTIHVTEVTCRIYCVAKIRKLRYSTGFVHKEIEGAKENRETRGLLHLGGFQIGIKYKLL